MATNGSIFGAMLQEFDGAARILNLEPGIWKILTHPKRQITVSCPVADGQRRDRSLHRLPRAVQHHPRPGQGRHPLSPGRDARRGDGARGLDDVEVRRRAHPVRRRQGRRHLRSDADVAARARSADAPLRRRDHRRHRAREGRAGARRQHQRSGDGVGDGHLQHARRPHRDRRRHRQAARARRIARPARSDRTRRDDRRRASRRSTSASTSRARPSPSRGSATSGRCRRELLAEIGAKIVAITDWKGGVYNAQRPRSREAHRPRAPAQDRRRAFPAASRSPTSSCSRSTSTC